MLWELDQAADIMKWYREFIVQAPEEINGFFAFLTVPPGPPFPEASAHEEDVRHRLVLSGSDRAGQRDPGADAQFPQAGLRILRAHAVPDAAGHVRRRCIRRACSGTGRRISSRN